VHYRIHLQPTLTMNKKERGRRIKQGVARKQAAEAKAEAKWAARFHEAQIEIEAAADAKTYYMREVTDLKTKLQARVNTTMLDQRIELCKSLGSLIEATAIAVQCIVAKESL
jgi:hypothetical protein